MEIPHYLVLRLGLKNNMRNFFKYYLFTLLIIISSLFNLGNSSFVVGGGHSATKGDIKVNDGGRAVCYNGTTKAKYTSIEGAFAEGETKSGDTIYCIPGENPIITRSFSIPSNVTLCIPYLDDLNNTHDYLNETGNNDSSNIGYGDNNDSYNKNKVTISKNVSITVNGNIILGGTTGSTRLQSGVVSNHCSIQMGTNTYIYFNSGSNFECYGFVKEDQLNCAHLKFNSGSNLTVPISFYDYASAGTMLDYMKNDVFPFKQYDIASIRPEMEFVYGCIVNGKVHTYGNTAGDIKSTPQLIGTSGSFINMGEGSIIKWKFSDSSSLTSTTNSMNTHSTNISVYGNASFGSLSVTIKYLITYNINSAEYYLPIPYGYNITLENNAYFVLPSSIKGVKFMPGSSVITKANSTIESNCGVLFYQSNKSYDGSNSFPYVTSNRATLVVAGNVILNSGFEGIIEIDSNAAEKNAKIQIGPNYAPITDSKELTVNTTYYSWGGAKGIRVEKKFDASNINNINYALSSDNSLSKLTSYLNIYSDESSCYGWYDGYSGVYGIICASQILGTFNSNGSNVVLSPQTSDNENYVFGGYYYDSNYSIPLSLSNGNYILEPNDAINYVGIKSYVELFINWVDANAGSYNINIHQKLINNHSSINDTSSTISYNVGTDYTLSSSSLNDYYYDSLVSNGSSGTGTYNMVTFTGYTINVTDNNNAVVYSNVNVDLNGNSSDGLVSNWVIDSSTFNDGYVVDVNANYNIETSSLSFSLYTNSNTVAVKNGTIKIRIDGSSSLTDKGLILTYSWKCDNAKGVIANSSARETILTNTYSGTGWASSNANLSCQIYDSTSGISLFNLSKTITLKRGLGE